MTGVKKYIVSLCNRVERVCERLTSKSNTCSVSAARKRTAPHRTHHYLWVLSRPDPAVAAARFPTARNPLTSHNADRGGGRENCAFCKIAKLRKLRKLEKLRNPQNYRLARSNQYAATKAVFTAAIAGAPATCVAEAVTAIVVLMNLNNDQYPPREYA